MSTSVAPIKRSSLMKPWLALVAPPVVLFSLFALLFRWFSYPAYILMLNYLILFVGLLVVLKADGLSLADVGWRMPGRMGLVRLIGAGLLLGIAMRLLDRFVLVKITDKIIGLFGVSVTPDHGASHSPLWAWIVAACLFASVVEESIYRGYVLTRFRKRMHPAWAVLISAAFFGLFHFGLGVEDMVDSMLFGAVLGILFIRWPTLWPLALAHGIANLLDLMGH